MDLKEQILAKMAQNKADRAKHQEQVEGLDRGLIYLQGQLDLVEQMLQIQAQGAADAAAQAAAQTPAPEAAPVESLPVAESSTETEAPAIA